jgi:hypothetical protein
MLIKDSIGNFVTLEREEKPKQIGETINEVEEDEGSPTVKPKPEKDRGKASSFH